MLNTSFAKKTGRDSAGVERSKGSNERTATVTRVATRAACRFIVILIILLLFLFYFAVVMLLLLSPRLPHMSLHCCCCCYIYLLLHIFDPTPIWPACQTGFSLRFLHPRLSSSRLPIIACFLLIFALTCVWANQIKPRLSSSRLPTIACFLLVFNLVIYILIILPCCTAGEWPSNTHPLQREVLPRPNQT